MAQLFKIYSKEELVKIYKESAFNRKKIKKKNHICGCFSCLDTFDSSEIVETCDNGQTVLCPYCGIDSVLHETKTRKITDTLLTQLYNRYFRSTYDFDYEPIDY
jgi:hypothetical protein